MTPYRPLSLTEAESSLTSSSLEPLFTFWQAMALRRRVFWVSVFLVSIPVFFQAPLVRWLPALSLLISGLWLFLGLVLLERPGFRLAGDILIGFTWTWLAGSIYWGWFRWEPTIHLPIEAIALPIVCWCIANRRAVVGSYFYLGSLLGTAITDVYFYWADLIPYWRSLMLSPPEQSADILHSALAHIQTLQGAAQAGILLVLLVMIGTLPLHSNRLQWWAFAGAVLSTILVDSLFGVAALLA
ncbi:MAG: DUF3120 domain-containing protein [Cyanobacteria bacterium P01_C01_bin.73]